MHHQSIAEVLGLPPFIKSAAYIQRENAILQRIAEITEYEEKSPRHGEREAVTRCKTDLVHLIGPKLATGFLKMFEVLEIVTDSHLDALSVETELKKYVHEVNLTDALNPMIRLMVKLSDNGESGVEDLSAYGDVQGIDLVNAVIAQLEFHLTEETMDRFDYLSTGERLPPNVMDDVHWEIAGPKFYTRANFNEAVHQHRLEICISGSWNPAMVAILASNVCIQCAGDEGIDYDLEFESDNGLWFTEGELLFKIHHALLDQCNESDHRFFEGLYLAKNQEHGKPPRYCLYLGS